MSYWKYTPKVSFMGKEAMEENRKSVILYSFDRKD